MLIEAVDLRHIDLDDVAAPLAEKLLEGSHELLPAPLDRRERRRARCLVGLRHLDLGRLAQLCEHAEPDDVTIPFQGVDQALLGNEIDRAQIGDLPVGFGDEREEPVSVLHERFEHRHDLRPFGFPLRPGELGRDVVDHDEQTAHRALVTLVGSAVREVAVALAEHAVRTGELSPTGPDTAWKLVHAHGARQRPLEERVESQLKQLGEPRVVLTDTIHEPGPEPRPRRSLASRRARPV